MPVTIARQVALSIRSGTASGPVEICWHGGEPLTAGRDYLGQFMNCFADLDVVHSVQTNATLVDQKWCDFFAERKVLVGVSSWCPKYQPEIDKLPTH